MRAIYSGLRKTAARMRTTASRGELWRCSAGSWRRKAYRFGLDDELETSLRREVALGWLRVRIRQAQHKSLSLAFDRCAGMRIL